MFSFVVVFFVTRRALCCNTEIMLHKKLSSWTRLLAYIPVTSDYIRVVVRMLDRNKEVSQTAALNGVFKNKPLISQWIDSPAISE